MPEKILKCEIEKECEGLLHKMSCCLPISTIRKHLRYFFFNASILVELQLQCEEAETFLIQLSALQCKSEDSLILAATYSINMIVS